jgi:ribosomal protein S18 acetylase RimI-like enzyme
LGVLQDGFIGLYDIVVDAELRRKGCGEQVVRDLLAWGKRSGAHSAYLQVMLNNPAALGLYAKVGYRAAYTYWYRVKG